MIKEKEQNNSYQYEYTIPAHWKERRHRKIDSTTFSTVIQIGNESDDFHKLLIGAIKSAKHTVMLCSFILSDTRIIKSIINASERGVRCYLLFSTDAQLEKEYKDEQSDFDKKTLEEHKMMLSKLTGKVLARTSEHLHAKFLLIDPTTENKKGFLSTANFTKEALTRNQEIGIILDKDETSSLFNLFRKGFWLESKQELTRIGHWDDVKTIKLKDISAKDAIINTSYSSRTLKEEISKLIKNASSELIISSYSFDIKHEIAQDLINFCKEKKLTILTRPKEKNYPFVEAAAKNGVRILAYKYLHAKFIMDSENELGIVMTANFEKRGLDEGFEVGIKLSNNSLSELEEIAKNWIESAPLEWKEKQSVQDCDVGFIQIPKGRDILKKEIIAEFFDDQGKRETKDLSEMNKLLKEKPVTTKKFEDKIPKKITVTRTIVPPKLPEEAEKIDHMELFITKKEKKQGVKLKPFKFPYEIFKLKSEYYVVLKSLKDLDNIQKYPKIKQNARFVSK